MGLMVCSTFRALTSSRYELYYGTKINLIFAVKFDMKYVADICKGVLLGGILVTCSRLRLTFTTFSGSCGNSIIC